MARRVFLHVGSPKTGTTFLQQVLWNQRDEAAAQGLLLPGDSVRDHFHASLDLRGAPEVEPGREAAAGAWDRLVARSRDGQGDVLVSHELFALAAERHARRAVADFADLGFDVHVVITARDLARQLPAHWQEAVKARWALTFDEYLHEELDEAGGGRYLAQVQDYTGLARRWGHGLPATAVHLVTVPPRGAPRDLLWRRFAGLLGLEPERFRLDVRANESLGLEQTELLRRLNHRLGERLPRPGPYPAVVKGVYAHQVLAGRAGTALRLGVDELALLRDRATAEVAELRRLGVDVVGDLDELLVADGAEAGSASDEVSTQVLLDEAIEGAIGLLEVMDASRRRQRDELARLRARVRDLETGRASRTGRIASRARAWLGRGGGAPGGTGT